MTGGVHQPVQVLADHDRIGLESTVTVRWRPCLKPARPRRRVFVCLLSVTNGPLGRLADPVDQDIQAIWVEINRRLADPQGNRDGDPFAHDHFLLYKT